MAPIETGETLRLGILYPGHAAEDDFDRLALMLHPPVVLERVHTPVEEDAHRADALMEVGSLRNLLPGAERLGRRGVRAAMWACTSGSFVFGWEGAHRQVRALAERLGRPVSSTSLAFAGAVRALGARRAAIAATYPAELTARFVEFLEHADVEVVAVGSRGIPTAADAGRLTKDQVTGFVTGADHPAAEAVLVPDTALHSVALIDDLEAALGKPILTANQVTVWEGLRLAGGRPRTGPGRLFRAARSGR